jgi:hypothetical protein
MPEVWEPDVLRESPGACRTGFWVWLEDIVLDCLLVSRLQSSRFYKFMIELACSDKRTIELHVVGLSSVPPTTVSGDESGPLAWL